MDISAQGSMKGAAKCDKHCELQDSVNQQVLERVLRLWSMSTSIPASVPVQTLCVQSGRLPCFGHLLACGCVCYVLANASTSHAERVSCLREL